MNRSLLLWLTLFVSGFAYCATPDGNLVYNGGFEDGFSGWKIDGKGLSLFVGTTKAPEGRNIGVLNGTISQSFPTAIGSQYRISALVAPNPLASNEAQLQAIWGGTALPVLAFQVGPSEYAYMSWEVVADSKLTLFTLVNPADSYIHAQFIDAISVRQIPEPSVSVLSALGLMTCYVLAPARKMLATRVFVFCRACSFQWPNTKANRLTRL